MDAEQRIQALEQELQILKSQIQVTLLDIQAYLLTNTYPNLRGNDSSPGTPKASSDDKLEDDSAGIKVNKVAAHPTLHQSMPEAIPAAKPAAPPPPPTPVMPEVKEAASIDGQEQWVMQKVDQIGPARTRDLIQVYAESGRFTPEVADLLMRFLELYTEVDTPTLPTRPAAAPARKSTAAVPHVPQAQVIPTETKKKRKNAPPPVPAPTPAPVEVNPVQGEGEEVPDEQSVVLRLIAGVQNAGAGVRWRKNNG
ncbi:MAG: hypothetical protein J0L63_06660 [Anaerolineae bacterium]|nr:hypothetical protein [Anaerolineae bacterium]MBN8618567.1 hypothetical protein [Anaerolineae bacterium]